MTRPSTEYLGPLDLVDRLDAAIALNQAIIMAVGNRAGVTRKAGDALGAVAGEVHDKLADIHGELEKMMEGSGS